MKKNLFPPVIASMRFPVPERTILARLGYSRHRTELEEPERRALAAKISGFAAMTVPRGCWTAERIARRTADTLELENGLAIRSGKVAERYSGAEWMWFGAATIGPELPAKSADLMRSGHTADAVIADAVGGECADASMDYLQKLAAAALVRQGMILAEFRFSPGYGDWTLEGQTLFFDMLDMAGLGITLTDSRMLLPEKTVTAAAGIVCG